MSMAWTVIFFFFFFFFLATWHSSLSSVKIVTKGYSLLLFGHTTAKKNYDKEKRFDLWCVCVPRKLSIIAPQLQSIS